VGEYYDYAVRMPRLLGDAAPLHAIVLYAFDGSLEAAYALRQII
jgi:hypothetical protein